MVWESSYDQCGSWYWSTGPLANGWSAQVSDHSQSIAPKQPTRYFANAVCRWWIVGDPRGFETLAEAKDAAFALVVAQDVASSDPRCRSDYREVAS